MKKLPSRSSPVSEFLEAAKKHPVASNQRNRLIFGMDATASREPTWDLATSLHGELFNTAQRSQLSVQLAYYRGFNDFYASSWANSPRLLLEHMQGVNCRGGATQILRLLRHIRKEASHRSLKAAVFIGDCCEEPPQELISAAGELALLRVPLFIFQEGHNPLARHVFSSMAQASGGAYAPFSRASARELAELLGAVAAYATEGNRAIKSISSKVGINLLTQIKR